MRFALNLTLIGITSLSFLLLTNEAVGRSPFLQELQQEAPKKLLFLTHAGLYKHTSLQPAEEALASWAPAHYPPRLSAGPASTRLVDDHTRLLGAV